MPLHLQDDDADYALARQYILEVYSDIPHSSDIRRYVPYILWALAPGEDRILPRKNEPINEYLDHVWCRYAEEFECEELNP